MVPHGDPFHTSFFEHFYARSVDHPHLCSDVSGEKSDATRCVNLCRSYRLPAKDDVTCVETGHKIGLGRGRRDSFVGFKIVVNRRKPTKGEG
jgi:hypothetical protein